MMRLYTKGMFLLSILAAQFTSAQDLVHYWNFNDNASVATITTPTISLVSGSAITGVESLPNTFIDFAGGTGQNFNIDNLNAQNGDAPGTHLRYNYPIAGSLEFSLPTTGYEDVIVRFATRRSGSGADDQLWSYSIDGTTYTAFTTINPISGNPTLQTLDFTNIPAVNDNPNFKLKVEFAQGAGGVEGNNRFDNFTLTATSLGGDTTAPIALLTPAEGAINMAIDVNPTISFNEEVRLLNDEAITDANVDAVVEVRLNNASGALVAFDATFAANVITINPTADLANNQVYYVALLPNTIEDLSDNALTDAATTTFTTIALQNAFNAGDMAIVAYRMSATGTEDGIAFVTFVDIPDGTTFNITDAKYSTNLIPQCSGGIVWTADGNTCIPAGSVITINTNALTANIGTVSGSGFGLSSNGDQVIIYTGTSIAPNYITALTSNGWVVSNTECGGSLSMLPSGLTDGTNTLNTSTAPGNVSGNSANGFYNGINDGEPAALRALILDPANWTISPTNTPPQTWPTWDFPKAIEITVSDSNATSNLIYLTFDSPVDPVSGAELSNYTGIDNLVLATVTGNLVTLTYSEAFPTLPNTLTIANVSGTDASEMACPYVYEFDGVLATENFNANDNRFLLYPNPSEGIVYFNRSANISVFDYTGKLLLTANNAKSIDASGFASGIYLVKTSEGISKKLIVR